MSPAAQSTYLPVEPEKVAAVFDFLSAHASRGGDAPPERYMLVGSRRGDEVEIPEHVYLILRDVIDAMHRNLAITIVPRTTMLTTQQAADILGVSRPTVVKLLEAGKIPFQKIGTHRRLLLTDLIDYQSQRRSKQYEFLASADLGADVDVETAVAVSSQARRAVAQGAEV